MEASAGAAGAPSGHQRSLPLVVLSPGFTSSRSTLTALAEDLTSHGYVVAGIDHTYESHATAFPDGRVATCLARQARQRGSASPEKVAAGRAADVSFVLGELTGAHPPRSRAAACPGRSFSWAASPATPREAGSSRRWTGNT